MRILITFLILSSGAFSSESSLLPGFCADVIYVRNLMKIKDVFEMKVLGHIHNEYDEIIARRVGLREDLIQERRERMEKAKIIKPLWTCELQGIMENVNKLHHMASNEVSACEKTRSPKSLLSDVLYYTGDSENIKGDRINGDLNKEIKEAWALTIEKVTELKDVPDKGCKEDLSKLLKGAGTKYLGAARYLDICHLMVKDINSIQKISEKCSD